MEIKCTNCNHTEKTDKDFFVKLIGGAMPLGGFWAWTTYLFAGTGFAMVIVVAIIGGGVAMLMFKDEIVEWIISQDYECKECGGIEWEPLDETKNEYEDIICPYCDCEKIHKNIFLGETRTFLCLNCNKIFS